jgi:hypothetical protein
VSLVQFKEERKGGVDAMKWDREPWRKLYVRTSAEWRALPLSARGLGDELIKYADDDGVCAIVNKDEHPGDAISRTLGAHAHEHARVREDCDALMQGGSDAFLVLRGNRLVIRNFYDAQNRVTASAVRMQRKRQKEKAEKCHSDAPCDASGDEPVTASGGGGVTGKRNEEKRNDSPSSPPNGGSPSEGETPKTPPHPWQIIALIDQHSGGAVDTFVRGTHETEFGAFIRDAWEKGGIRDSSWIAFAQHARLTGKPCSVRELLGAPDAEGKRTGYHLTNRIREAEKWARQRAANDTRPVTPPQEIRPQGKSLRDMTPEERAQATAEAKARAAARAAEESAA